MVKRHNSTLSRKRSKTPANAARSAEMSVATRDRPTLRTRSRSSTAIKTEAHTCRVDSGTHDLIHFQAKLNAWKALIEEDLEKGLPPAEEPPNPPIHKAIRHSILSGGHRYRPVLLLAVADALGVSQSSALALARVPEMIHSASIILDDLPSFDDANIRHGKSSCHKEFGEHIAILASLRLTVLSVETIWRSKNNMSPEAASVLECEYTELLNNMIRGESMDLATQHEQIDAKKLIDIYIRKSGRLFAFAAVGGALLGHATSAEIKALREYSLKLGLAYQILDDIYDVQGGPDSVGKAQGMDAKNQKATTFPLLYGVSQSLVLMEKYKREACAHLDQFGDKFAILKELAGLIAPS